MSIITPMTTYEMRSKEGGTLHRWQRNLNALFPQLGVTDRKEGWLQKRGDSANAMFTKRWCVLDSNYRMTYFKDQKREKEQGSVDLSVAYAASETSGNGFEIATPGRTWVFKAEDKDVQASWMAALSAMLNDLREVKKEQQARTGTSMLKAEFAAYRDDAELEEGGTNSEWVKRQWWELTGNGILIVYEKEGGKVVKEIQLSDVTKVDRTKGDEYYQYCIDLDVEPAGKEERTITLKPPNRSDMASWLGLLKEQMSLHAKHTVGGGEGGGSASLSVVRTGWMTLTRRNVDEIGKKFFVIVTEQSQAGDDVMVTHTLYWFSSESESKDLGCGSALSLVEVEAVEQGEGDKVVTLVTEEHAYDFLCESTHAVSEWKTAFRQSCVNAEGYEPPQEMTSQKAGGGDGTLVYKDALKMAVGLDAGTSWKSFTCELHSDGGLSYTMDDADKSDDVPPEWLKGRVDLMRAIGTWLVGEPGWLKLDVILPGGMKLTFAAEKDTTLERWHKQIKETMPHKPVMELCKGGSTRRARTSPGGRRGTSCCSRRASCCISTTRTRRSGRGRST